MADKVTKKEIPKFYLFEEYGNTSACGFARLLIVIAFYFWILIIIIIVIVVVLILIVFLVRCAAVGVVKRRAVDIGAAEDRCCLLRRRVAHVVRC